MCLLVVSDICVYQWFRSARWFWSVVSVRPSLVFLIVSLCPLVVSVNSVRYFRLLFVSACASVVSINDVRYLCLLVVSVSSAL